MIYIKIHKAYRNVVAVCDADLIGKKFEEGDLQLEVHESFYKGKLFEEEEAIEILQEQRKEDATFNFTGEKAIAIGLKAGIINKQGIITIQGIPHALALL